ncbi:MAG TPA: lipopolysaccharide kinase InaA family protein, partial [Longimicrobiaceae bacterium]|nr:lipopolysaccharide kinase InaA family protein [Longimicrobiaceae bacterium]
PDGRDLFAWLAAEADETRRTAVLGEGARQIALMHAAGVAHPDLNLRNLLVAGDEVYLLDFDKAAGSADPVPTARRARDLRRLARSARKLHASIDWPAFRAGYGDAWPPGLDLAKLPAESSTND